MAPGENEFDTPDLEEEIIRVLTQSEYLILDYVFYQNLITTHFTHLFI